MTMDVGEAHAVAKRLLADARKLPRTPLIDAVVKRLETDARALGRRLPRRV